MKPLRGGHLEVAGKPSPGSIPTFYRSKQCLVHKVVRHASRFLVSGRCPISYVGEGRQGSQRSAREAGIGKETGYRWLREAYVAYRRGGKCIAETEAVMGLASAKSIAWEAEVAAGPRQASPSRRRRYGGSVLGGL